MLASVLSLINEWWVWLPAYLPLGAVGAWRWSVWGLKRMLAMLYQPRTTPFTAPVSVVVPVYNEDPQVFARALDSWRDNGAAEIVAVIDYTDEACRDVFRRWRRTHPRTQLIVTRVPGKRPALADGIRVARGEIVALVDSDTIWERGALAAALCPLADSRIGGVTVRQIVAAPRTLAQRLYAMQQNLRFLEEYPFLAAIDGSTVHCLSGRTALYRRAALLPALPELVHETFWGEPVISGDDKRLTYLVQSRGWRVAYQQSAVVYTPGEARLRVFLKQRLRWARNSWRADLRALSQGWTWRRPYFALYLIDRALQPLALLMGPIYCLASLLLGLWQPAFFLLGWWHVSRAVRLLPHLRRSPRDIALVPVYVGLNFYFALLKLYALFTLNQQGWITRWDANRLHRAKWLSRAPAYAATGLTLLMLSGSVLAYKSEALRGGGATLSIAYSAAGNVIRVGGLGQAVSLYQISRVAGHDRLREVAPGVWYLAADLRLGPGIVLEPAEHGFERFVLASPGGRQVQVVQE